MFRSRSSGFILVGPCRHNPMNISLPTRAVFFLLLLAGCTTSKPDDGTRSLSGSDAIQNALMTGADGFGDIIPIWNLYKSSSRLRECWIEN